MKEENTLNEEPSENDEVTEGAELIPDGEGPPPSPEQQRQIISAIDSECTCTYAVAKSWYRKWEEYVGGAKGSQPGVTEAPGPLEMDTNNDANNEYVNEEIWKLMLRWYGISPTHQLDRKHLYFKDEKMFDVCVLSPFSGIVEHQLKKFNRFEEIGYIECQLRKIFQVAEHKRSRLWISEKAQVPRFRQLLLRSRMLNDCIHRDKVYILALEECLGEHAWPTGEPGEPKGDLHKYKDIVLGARPEDYWAQELGRALADLEQTVTESVRKTAEVFLRNGQSVLREREGELEASRKGLAARTDEASARQKFLDERARELARQEEVLRQEKEQLGQRAEEVQAQETRLQEQVAAMERLHTIQESKIKLDIGGQIFSTSMQTLRRDEESMLAAMFSGRFELKKEADGSYFIDRDGTYFRYILNFLRDGCIEAGTLPNDRVMIKELLREAKYYQLGSLTKELEERLGAIVEK